VAEAAAAVLAFEPGDGDELARLDRLHHELGDAVAAVHLIGIARIGVHQDHLELVAVAGVDEAGGVQHGHPVAKGQSAAGQDEAGMPGGDGHSNTCRHEGTTAAGVEQDVDAGHEIETGVALARVCRQGQLGIEADDGQGEHRSSVREP